MASKVNKASRPDKVLEKRPTGKAALPAYTLPATGDALIPDVKVAAALDCGVSTVWLRVRSDPDFPQPVQLGPRSTRFSVAQLRGWIERRAAAGEAPNETVRKASRAATDRRRSAAAAS